MAGRTRVEEISPEQFQQPLASHPFSHSEEYSRRKMAVQPYGGGNSRYHVRPGMEGNHQNKNEKEQTNFTAISRKHDSVCRFVHLCVCFYPRGRYYPYLPHWRGRSNRQRLRPVISRILVRNYKKLFVPFHRLADLGAQEKPVTAFVIGYRAQNVT